MKVVIIIPTYNEAESTPKMVAALAKIIPTVKSHTVNVLYVDDSSPDGTADIVRNLQKNNSWLHLLVNPKKDGLGMAYSAGMKYAMRELKADYVMEFDADFQHPPQDIPRLIAQIDNNYDYIVGSRYVKGGSIPKNWSFERKFLSVIGNLVARVLLFIPRIHDVTGGFKLSRVKGFVDQFDFSKLLSKRFAYKVHLFFYMYKKGAKIKEVPFAFGNRDAGESKIIKNEMQETLRVIFLLQYHNPKIRKFIKFGAVGFIGFLVNSASLELFSKTQYVNHISKLFMSLEKTPILSLMAHSTAWAGAFAAEAAIISNYNLNNFWTFKSARAKTIYQYLRKFIKFNIASLGAVLIQFTVIGLATSFLADTALIRQVSLIIAIVMFIVPYNWFMYNTYVWKKK